MPRAAPTPLERALALAADGGGRALFAHGGALYVATEPVERVSEREASRGLARFAAAVERWRDARAGGAPRAFGWLAYDAARGDEPGGFGDGRPRGDDAPAACLARYDAVLRVDEATGEARAYGPDDGGRARLERAWGETRAVALGPPTPAPVASATDEGAHRAAVESVRASIREGDVYLVNVARVVHTAAPLARVEVARRVLRAAARHAALIDGDAASIGGMSMELALAWDRASGALETRPIKGTRPRGADAAEDARLAAELAADPKERAENAMAVDVHRNDLGRVAAPGSVTVPALCAVEAHAFVHHLVSTVRARVADGVGVADVLAAVLPVGSVTGAPKRAAMVTIARLEAERRGVYTGVYGAVGGDGSLALAVAIRTIVTDARGSHYGAGGGVVYDSEPAREWRELAWKERALAG